MGFLEHLPKPLLAAFDATLKEAQKADLLLHIIDISDPQFAIKREVTIQTLQRIGCAQVPCMEVYNKVDLCSDLQEEKRNDALYISAHSEEGMRQLLRHWMRGSGKTALRFPGVLPMTSKESFPLCIHMQISRHAQKKKTAFICRESSRANAVLSFEAMSVRKSDLVFPRCAVSLP